MWAAIQLLDSLKKAVFFWSWMFIVHVMPLNLHNNPDLLGPGYGVLGPPREKGGRTPDADW